MLPQNTVKNIFLHEKIKDYIAQIIDASRNPHDYGLNLGKYIEWGGSPRASINFFIAAKANAFLEKRWFVIPQDIKDIAYNILRHRILLTYDAKVNDITPERVIYEILSKIKVP